MAKTTTPTHAQHTTGRPDRPERPARPTGTEHGQHVDVLLACAKTCNETFAYCIQEGGQHVKAEHLQTMVDCAQVCSLGADLMARGSPLSHNYMELCATACKNCEESCEEFEGDSTMQMCADVCRECYEACS
jgi:hypothetical protein